ncbi:MAG: IMP dehydrogenase [Candidatus Liptonbacteria bacterium]|nr:IMP dehydrogenase [Candidatus Liptonbacteria bacterium]
MTDELAARDKQAIDEHFHKIGLPREPALTFKDAAIKPRYNEIRIRSEIWDFSTTLIGDVAINIPLISANMTSVTDAKFAAALEREGGFGCFPQAVLSCVQDQMIDDTRRNNAARIDDPLKITPYATIAEAKKLMETKQVWSLIVVDADKRPIGILSSRDWRYETDLTQKVSALMTTNIIKCRDTDSVEAVKVIMRRNKIEKIPIVDEAGKLVGLYTAHGLFYKMHHTRALRDEHGRFPVMGTVGVGERLNTELMEQVNRLAKKGIQFLLIDAAKGGSDNLKEVVLWVKKELPNLPIMAGNVCTPEETKLLIEWGVDTIKVGQGPGYVCRTREIGIGIPQLTAVAECSAIANLYDKLVVADGGMDTPGDFMKAIIAGATACMAGKFFMSTYEAAAPLEPPDDDGLPFKLYKGSASFDAQMERIQDGSLDHPRRPEGRTRKVIVTGSLKDKIYDLLEAFKSGMSYVGARNWEEMREIAVMRWQTPAGSFEGLKR